MKNKECNCSIGTITPSVSSYLPLLYPFHINKEVETFPQNLPTGFRGKSNHHLANFSAWQIDKLANILLLLIGLLKKNANRECAKIPFQVHDVKLSVVKAQGSCLASKTYAK